MVPNTFIVKVFCWQLSDVRGGRPPARGMWCREGTSVSSSENVLPCARTGRDAGGWADPGVQGSGAGGDCRRYRRADQLDAARIYCEILTTEEVAALLKLLSVQTIYKWIA